MINYDPKNWAGILLSVHNTVLHRLRVRLILIVALTTVVFLIHRYAPDFPIDFLHSKPVAHTLVGVALGLLVVFRNNTSYDRFWEGRKLWGSLVNSSRNLIRGASVYVGPDQGLAKLVHAYVLALKQHLRGNLDISEIKGLIPEAIYERAKHAGNPPTILAYHMSAWLVQHHRDGKMDSYVTQSLEKHIREMVEAQGGCERILRTPIPFVYAVHIKQLLFLYLVTLPFTLVNELQWMAIPSVAVIAFGLLGIEEASVEIEDPFGDDPNDLPLEAICATIGRDTAVLSELQDEKPVHLKD
jgi:ion channel-forming bestrophin family protein